MVLNSIPAASTDPKTWVGEVVGEYRLTGSWWTDRWSHSFVATTDNNKEVVIAFFYKDWARETDPQQRVSKLLPMVQQFSKRQGVRTCLGYGRVTSGLLAGLDYVVMEDVEGESLGRHLLDQSNHRLSVPDAALIVHEVAMILHAGHAHRTGDAVTPVFHGSLHLNDVILISKPPRPRICVGGYERLAFLRAALQAEFREQRDQGRPPVGEQELTKLSNVPPEVLSRRQSQPFVDEKSDVYCLGILFWTLVFGRSPFRLLPTSETMADLWIRMHNSASPAPPPDLWKRTGKHLQDLMLICIKSDPDHRPSSPISVAKALELLVPEVARAQGLPAGNPEAEEDSDGMRTIHQVQAPFPQLAGPPARPEPFSSPPLSPLPPPPEKPEPLSASAPLLTPGPGATFAGTWEMGDGKPLVAKKQPPTRWGWGAAIFVVAMLFVLPVVAISVWPNVLHPEASRVRRQVRRVPAPTPTQEAEVVVADAEVEPVFTEVVRPPQPVVQPVQHPSVPVVDPSDSSACTLAVINAGLHRHVTNAQKAACLRYCAASATRDEVRRRSERFGLCPRAGPSPVQP